MLLISFIKGEQRRIGVLDQLQHEVCDLSQVARDKYGMGGAVQHGASTLPDDLFNKFPEVKTLEIHLATGFQNIVYQVAGWMHFLTRVAQVKRSFSSSSG